jgi:hypothetical protein
MSTCQDCPDVPHGVSRHLIDKYTRDHQLLRLVHRARKLDHEHDLPYLAGYSTDGETIYIDRHLPKTLHCEHDGRKYSFDPVPFLQTHESWEKALIDHFGWKYGPAHQVATKIEHRQVLAHGIPIHLYDGKGSELQKYIKADEHEKLKKVPQDLDLTPYHGDHRLLNKLVNAMGRAHEKHKS